MIPARVLVVARWLPVVAAIPFAYAVLFVASVLPFRDFDALAYGSWPRDIAESGDLFGPILGDSTAGRPLVYLTQGLLWLAFGYHEWIGRCWSAVFGLALPVALWLVAAHLTPRLDARVLVRSFAVLAPLASAVLATYAAAGLTDVPTAACSALTAAALLSSRLGRAQLPLVAAGAAATILAKPSGVLAVAGLCLAAAFLARRQECRRPALTGAAGMGAGIVVALAWDAWHATRLDISLVDLLRAGDTPFYREAGAAARTDTFLRADWLGPDVRLPLLFGVVLALARAAGLAPRLAAPAAAVGALAWSVAGPWIADGRAPYPFDGAVLGLLGYGVLAASIVTAAITARDDPFGRRTYGALLLWAAPGLLVWLAYRPDEPRLLGPAWPPLVLLAAAGLTVAALTLVRLRPWAVLAPVAATALVAIVTLPAVDGLRRDGWRELLELGPDGWNNRAAIENFAFGPFSYELAALRTHVGDGEQIVSSDGRLRYFFPRRVEVFYATSCASLRSARAFVLLTGDESREIMRREGGSFDPLAWVQCERPSLRLVEDRPGIHHVFVVGRLAAEPDPAACGVAATPGQLIDAIFGENLTYEAARALRERAARVGYVTSKIERTGCDRFRVVVTGVPTPAANRRDFLRESSSVGFRVRLTAPQRYPEVPPDVPPVR